MTKCIEAEFTIHLPRKMSKNEYEELKSTLIRRDVWKKLYESFTKDGKILLENYRFFSDRSVSSILFRSKEHLSEWLQETKRLNTHNHELIASSGLRISREVKEPTIQTLTRRQALRPKHLEAIREPFAFGHMLILLSHACSKDAIAIDCGSNIGQFTWPMAALSSKVYAFDPVGPVKNPMEISLLRNFEFPSARLGPKIVHSAIALGDHESVIKYFKFGQSGLNTVLAPQFWDHKSPLLDSRTVEINTLDKLFPEPKVGFIKIDTEGSDWDVVQGSQSVIERDRPIIAFEFGHPGIESKLAEIFAWFRSRNYGIWPLEAATRSIGDMETADPDAFRYAFLNLMALPLEHRQLPAILKNLNAYDEFCAEILRGLICGDPNEFAELFCRKSGKWILDTWRSQEI